MPPLASTSEMLILLAPVKAKAVSSLTVCAVAGTLLTGASLTAVMVTVVLPRRSRRRPRLARRRTRHWRCRR